jgi:hypothetical protein
MTSRNTCAQRRRRVSSLHVTASPAGVLIGFANEDDWFDYCLENDPRFLKRIAAARDSLRAGKGVALKDVAFTDK